MSYLIVNTITANKKNEGKLKAPQKEELICQDYNKDKANCYINLSVIINNQNVESCPGRSVGRALASRASVCQDIRVRDFTRIPARAPTLKRLK